MSGIVGDARILIDHARVESQNHRFSYNEPMNINSITQSISDIAINFGEGYEGSKRKAMARPYGVALLLAGVDETGPHLYQTDPSGTFLEWQARAIGSGGETAMGTIKDEYHSNMKIEEAEKLAIKTLKDVMEDKITNENIELAVVTTNSKKLEKRSAEYLQQLISSLPA